MTYTTQEALEGLGGPRLQALVRAVTAYESRNVRRADCHGGLVNSDLEAYLEQVEAEYRCAATFAAAQAAEVERSRARDAHRDEPPRDTRERLRVSLRQRVLK